MHVDLFAMQRSDESCWKLLFQRLECLGTNRLGIRQSNSNYRETLAEMIITSEYNLCLLMCYIDHFIWRKIGYNVSLQEQQQGGELKRKLAVENQIDKKNSIAP